MNPKNISKHIYQFPGGDFFKSYLQAIASTLIGNNLPTTRDETLLFILRLKEVAPMLFDIVGAINEPVTEHSTTTEDDNDSFMLTTVTQTILTRGDARFTLTLDRMFNGHLGCNEDYLAVLFEMGGKKFTLSCYIFCSPDMVLETSGCSNLEIEGIDCIFKEQLGLLEKK